MSSRTRLIVLAWMLLLAAGSLILPASAHLYVWGALGLSSVAAMVVGIRRNKPRRTAPWYLLAAAVACLAAGDATAESLARFFDQPDPFPSVADVFYLLMYLLVAAGMVGLYRLGVVSREGTGVLDALTLTTGVALITWVYLIGPYVANPDLTLLQKVISIAYPLGDILVLGAGASLVASTRATPTLRLLAIGGIGLLGSDIAYGILQLQGDWQLGTPVDLGWAAFYVCWGQAALHPSMRDLTEPKIIRPPTDRRGRLVLLGLASLIAPVLLAVEALTGGVRNGLAIAVLSAVLSVLVLTRLARALRIQRRSVRRERALRRAGTELLSATSADEVYAVVGSTMGRLLPRRRPRQVVIDVADQTLAATVAGAPTRSQADADADTRPAMIYTTDLPAGLAARLGGFDVVLRCDLPADQGRAGALYVAADEAVLVALQESAQVLAAQAGQTLQRLALTSEIDQRNSEAYFRTLVLNAADVILILDADDRIRYASPSATTLFQATDLTGAALPQVVEQVSADEVRRRLDRVRAGDPDEQGPEWHFGRPDADDALVEATCRDLRGEPTVDGLVVTLRDMTDRRRMQDELYRRATYDALTGLPNREAFATTTRLAIGRASADRGRAGVVVTGLDDFKLVNNTVGHRAGDELLAMVGQRLTDAMRAQSGVVSIDAPEWTVARLGADEFASCVCDVTEQSDIDRLVTAAMSCFADPYVLSQGAVTLGASVGVAMADGDADARELLRQADLALSVAKDAGKGRMMQYDESLHTLMADRLQLRGDLERALAEGSFTLEYQPIAALPSRRTAGFEALVRWHHPQRGRLSPTQFITLAEESGLIVPLGNWVLHHAVRSAARWHHDPGDDAPYVSVNVSARQLRSAGFVGRVRDELALAGLPPQRLVLEITESLLAREAGEAEYLARLRADGIRIAIDDFGTGFSSLSYLRQLPIDLIKLDKSFADTIATSDKQYAVIATVTQLARTLQLDVVAEGIETEKDLDALSRVGCGFGQGYVLAPPMAYEDVERWLLQGTAEVAGEARRGR